MKFIEVNYLEATRFMKSIDFFRCFMSLNKSFVDISDLLLPYNEAKKIVATEDSASNELFMIPLAYDKTGAELLCKALKMYHLSENFYYDTDKKAIWKKKLMKALRLISIRFVKISSQSMSKKLWLEKSPIFIFHYLLKI